MNFMRTSNGSAMVAVMCLRVNGAVQKPLFGKIVVGVCGCEWAFDCLSNVARDAERFKLKLVSES